MKVCAAAVPAERQQPDCDLTGPVIERHEKLFGERPVVLAADKGFCPEKSKFEELGFRQDGGAGRVLPQPDRAGGPRVRVTTATRKNHAKRMRT